MESAQDNRTDSPKPAKADVVKEQLFSGVFVLIVCISLSAFLVGQGANAGTSVYLERIGSSQTLAGIGALTFSLAAAITRIFCGPLVDIKGRQRYMVAGASVMIVGTLGPLFTNDGATFILWRILQGIGFSSVTTAAATAAADVVAASRLGEGIGYYGLGQAIAMSIGPALAVWLVSTDDPNNLYVGLLCISVISLALSVACRYEKDPKKLPETCEYRIRYERRNVPSETDSDGKRKPSLKEFALDIFEPAALRGTIPLMFITSAFGFGIFFVSVFGLSIDIASPGIFFTISAIAMIITRLSSGKFMDKVKPIKIMGVAVIGALIAYSLLLSCTCLESGAAKDAVFYIAGIPYGLSLGIALPINQAVAVKLSPPSRWGAANALYLLGNDMGIGIASLVFGFINSAFGFAYSIICVLIMVALSFFVAMICYPKESV